MKNPENQIYSKDQIIEELKHALLRKALFDLREERVDRLQEQAESDVAMQRHVAARRNEVLTLIGRSVRRWHAESFVRQTIPKVGRIAGALILIFFICLTTAIATISDVRVKVMELLINIEGRYTEIGLIERDVESIVIPAEWNGAYFPSSIPDGYEMVYCNQHSDNGYYNIMYQNADGKALDFIEGQVSSSVNIDTEDASIEFIMIHGNPGIMAQKEEKVYISWSEYQTYFILIYDGTAQNAMEIAEKVIRIK